MRTVYIEDDVGKKQIEHHPQCIVPVFLSFLAMPGLCCFCRVTCNALSAMRLLTAANNIKGSCTTSHMTFAMETSKRCIQAVYFSYPLCTLDELTALPHHTLGIDPNPSESPT